MHKDPRVARTEAAIRGAFIRLVEERGYARVSVKDICERADINRNTFYLHYADKEALMSQILQTLLESQTGPIAAIASHISTATPEEVEDNMMALLKLFQEEIVFYRIIFTDPDLQSYIQRLVQTAFTMISLGAKRAFSPVTLSYMLYGFIGVVTEWLKRSAQDPAEIAPQLSRLLLGSLPEFHEI